MSNIMIRSFGNKWRLYIVTLDSGSSVRPESPLLMLGLYSSEVTHTDSADCNAPSGKFMTGAPFPDMD